MRRQLVPALALLLAACGGAPARPTLPAPPLGPSRTIHGTLRYEARHATPRGLSAVTDWRPGRSVDVVAKDERGSVLARTATGPDGAFTITAPAAATDLFVVAHATAEGVDVAVAHDEVGRATHELRVQLSGIGAETAIDVRDADAGGFAGALHLLDTLLAGMVAAERWSGTRLPPVFAYWGRGETTVWSFYRGERPPRSGRYALELMGGEPGRRETTDSDDHDEAIVLHELGHFVFAQLSGDSSIGGLHPTGTLIDPGVAWEEGRATWFATMVLGAPFYRDTIGIEPQGRLRVDFDLEQGEPAAPQGNGSESSVEAVLWDLADGVPGVPDRDNDGVALGPERLLRAMMAMAREPGAFPCLSTFLRFLVRTAVVTQPALLHMLAVSGQRDSILPTDDVSPWPIDLPLPGRVNGKIDGVTRPTMGGGDPRTENGQNAVHAYRVIVPRAGRLVLRLTILGTGRAVDHEDLDLELRDARADRIAFSNREPQVESIAWQVSAGTYVVYVRDGGTGNRAGYELEARLE